MKPAPFEYHAPTTLEAAVALLDELRDEDAKILAGGQSLLPMLNMRLARPAQLVDVNGLRELDYVRVGDDGWVALGALTRHRTLERSAAVARALPLLAEAMPLVGDRQIRHRGTVGGSLAHADPAAELPTIVVTLGAELVLQREAGVRVVPAEEFFVTFLTTVLEPDELLVEIRLPGHPPGAGCAFLELARQQGAFALVTAAAVVVLEGGRVADVRLGLGGVAPTPLRARRAEDVLRGEAPSTAALAEAGRVAAEDTDPTGDVHGDAPYRREMAAVYARRALAAAVDRAQARAEGAA